MSDHVDGPRSISEPAADLTDLFAFMSPESPAHTVLAACVFTDVTPIIQISEVVVENSAKGETETLRRSSSPNMSDQVI
ncbi:DUF4331 family protein [Bradyrhizobium tropiciagri]|uniref:DUF4331 family protein n=1 Tax=Bradyrhizobium tropiciagri TaxID=312253 RepID=UPI00067E16E8|nr:DUF4331 family protein [Bradyrhizobium tropiciagri]